MICMSCVMSGFTIRGKYDLSESFGVSVAIGDVNGDGIDDIFGGAHEIGYYNETNRDAGGGYVLYGTRDETRTSFSLDQLTPTLGM